MNNLLVFLFKLVDPVLAHVQLTLEYRMSVNPVLYLLDMQHVQLIILGLTLHLLKHAHLLVSKIYMISQGHYILAEQCNFLHRCNYGGKLILVVKCQFVFSKDEEIYF